MTRRCKCGGEKRPLAGVCRDCACRGLDTDGCVCVVRGVDCERGGFEAHTKPLEYKGKQR